MIDTSLANMSGLLWAPKNPLKGIAKSANELATDLHELDILTREDLGNRINPKDIAALIGSLGLLGKVATGLAEAVQGNWQTTRPRGRAMDFGPGRHL